jgi:precorrin-4/cobalt-precorrin-4 C11-methyltransferase
MPEDLLALCPPDARVIDTGPLDLDQIITELADAHAAGLDVARLHSGDPSIYSARPNNADDSTRSASTTKSCPVYRRSPPPQPCWAASHGAGVAQTGTADAGGDLVDRDAAGEDLQTPSASGSTLAAPGRRADRRDRAHR